MKGMDEAFASIPEGWKFFSCEASLKGEVRVTLIGPQHYLEPGYDFASSYGADLGDAIFRASQKAAEKLQLLKLKEIENWFRCGYREARYSLDPSLGKSEACPEEDSAAKLFMAGLIRQREAVAGCDHSAEQVPV